jgi:hypothetical protein
MAANIHLASGMMVALCTGRSAPFGESWQYPCYFGFEKRKLIEKFQNGEISTYTIYNVIYSRKSRFTAWSTSRWALPCRCPVNECVMSR